MLHQFLPLRRSLLARQQKQSHLQHSTSAITKLLVGRIVAKRREVVVVTDRLNKSCVKIGVTGFEEVIPQVIRRQIVPFTVLKRKVLNKPLEVGFVFILVVSAEELENGSLIGANVLCNKLQQIRRIRVHRQEGSEIIVLNVVILILDDIHTTTLNAVPQLVARMVPLISKVGFVS